MNKMVFWNDGNPRVITLRGKRGQQRLTMPDGSVRMGTIEADPENDLYAYAEAGPRPSEFEVAGPSYWTNDGWTATLTRTVVPMPVEDIRSIMLDRLAGHRYQVEVGGVDLNGIKVDTDREIRANLIGARINAVADPAYSLHWKTPAGFVLLDAATIIIVADAVSAHVQACFDREAELSAVIQGSDTPELVDITTGWPGTAGAGA